jgi:hypothetical protein
MVEYHKLSGKCQDDNDSGGDFSAVMCGIITAVGNLLYETEIQVGRQRTSNPAKIRHHALTHPEKALHSR